MENHKCLFCSGPASKGHLGRCATFNKLREMKSNELEMPEFNCQDFEKYEMFAALVKVL